MYLPIMFRIQRNRHTAINNAFDFIPHKVSLKMLIKEKLSLVYLRAGKIKQSVSFCTLLCYPVFDEEGFYVHVTFKGIPRTNESSIISFLNLLDRPSQEKLLVEY